MIAVLVTIDSKTNSLLLKSQIVSKGFLSSSTKTDLIYEKSAN